MAVLGLLQIFYPHIRSHLKCNFIPAILLLKVLNAPPLFGHKRFHNSSQDLKVALRPVSSLLLQLPSLHSVLPLTSQQCQTSSSSHHNPGSVYCHTFVCAIPMAWKAFCNPTQLLSVSRLFLGLIISKRPFLC